MGGPGLTRVRPAVVGNECSETYAPGAVFVRLTARAAAGSGFKGWGGTCAGTADCVVTMSAARAVTATFATFRLTVTTAGVGGGTVGGPGSRACGRRSSATSAARPTRRAPS